MFRASRAVALATKTGEALPDIGFLRDWHATPDTPNPAQDHRMYRGELVMVAGKPGAFKSMLTLAMVQETGLHALYLSADSDAATQTSRLAANITGHNHKDIRQQMVGNPDALAYYADALQASNVQFSFDSSPDPGTVDDEIDAYVELYDRYPDIIVLDNLRNVWSGADNEYAGYRAILQDLLDKTRSTGSTIIVLHHMLESKGNKSTTPAPRSDIDGKTSQLPELILSVARDGDMFMVSTVKDRHSMDDPEAKTWVTIEAHPDKAQFRAVRQLQDRANEFVGTPPVEDVAWSPTAVLGY